MRYLNAIILTSTLATFATAQSPGADSDLDLVSAVKTVLAAEAGKLPLTVSVQDGVAVVGGAVPKAAMGDAIAARLKTLPGLKDVRLNLWVPAHEDPLASAVKAKLKDTVAIAPMAPAVTLMPVLRPALNATPPMTMVAQRADTGYSPVPPPAPPAPAGGPEHATIPPPRVPVLPGQNVAVAAEAVKLLDARFQKLKLAIHYGTVTITGADMDAAWDLAALVRKVPGVEKVIVR
jgi:hypothetical protein